MVCLHISAKTNTLFTCEIPLAADRLPNHTLIRTQNRTCRVYLAAVSVSNPLLCLGTRSALTTLPDGASTPAQLPRSSRPSTTRQNAVCCKRSVCSSIVKRSISQLKSFRFRPTSGVMGSENRVLTGQSRWRKHTRKRHHNHIYFII
jgi:hypothetical protein